MESRSNPATQNRESLYDNKNVKSVEVIKRLGLAAIFSVIGGGLITIASETSEATRYPASAMDTGGYPWADADKVPQPPATDRITWGYTSKQTCDSKSVSYDCSSFTRGGWFMRDQWGYDLRNCTSYVAWKVAHEFGVNLSGWGHAKYWDNNASRRYIVDRSPEPGDIAQWEGTYGHVAFVESVNPDGSVNILQYNAGLTGQFSRQSSRRADNYIDINGTGVSWGSTTEAAPPPNYARSETNITADFNGDGFDDLFASSVRGDPAQNEQVFRGHAWLGGAELWGAPPADKITYNDAVNVPADINGDGKDDLLTITTNANGINPNIYWQKSSGSSFEAPQLVGVPDLIARNTRWTAGDVTGDGKEDLIALSKRGDPGANFIVFRSLGGWLGGGEFWGNTTSTIPFEHSDFLPGDKDGDGKTDLYAIAKTPERVEPHIYWLRSSGGNFTQAVLTAVPGADKQHIRYVSADLNGDNRDDLLAVSKRGDTAPNLVSYISDGGVSYSSMNLWGAPGELRWADVQVVPADVDADGDEDILAIQNHNGTNPGIYWLPSLPGHFDSPRLVGVPNAVYGQIRFQK